MAEHESLAAIAGQVAELRTDIAQFAARLDQETGPVMVLPVKVKKLQEQVENLSGELAQALDTGKVQAPSAPRWDGRDPEAEAAQLAELRAWVDRSLRVQYPGYLRSLPSCWPNHREALWELGVLQAEWARVFGTDAPPLAEAQWWHERWLPGALQRLKTAISCDEGGCNLQTRQTRAHAPDFSRASVDPRIASSFPRRPRPQS